MPVIHRRYLAGATVCRGAIMQVNENVGHVQQLTRIPDVDGDKTAKRAMLQTLDDGPRPAATKKSEVADEPKRKRFGAGF